MKKICLLIILLLSLTGCKNSNEYTINLKDEKITICGEEKYLSDYTYNNEFDISSLKDDITNCEESLNSDKEFYKELYIDMANQYEERLHELGIDEYILTDTSR